MKKDLTFGQITIPATNQVRISTLNLLNNPRRLQERVESFCRELNRVQPDIVCLQEVIFEEEDLSLSLRIIKEGTNLKNINSMSQHTNTRNVASGIAIASSLPEVETGYFHLDNNNLTATNKNALYSVFGHHSGSVVIAITAHLHWGGEQEYGRLTQLAAVNRKAKELAEQYKDRHPIIVLGGDLNAVPEGDAIRFMTGKAVGLTNEGAYWVDAWELLGNETNRYTSLPLNYWSRETALNNNILLPELLPSRRIDYLLSYGWSYGKHGSPLTFQQSFITEENGIPISDHSGLTADYWVRF